MSNSVYFQLVFREATNPVSKAGCVSFAVINMSLTDFHAVQFKRLKSFRAACFLFPIKTVKTFRVSL